MQNQDKNSSELHAAIEALRDDLHARITILTNMVQRLLPPAHVGKAFHVQCEPVAPWDKHSPTFQVDGWPALLYVDKALNRAERRPKDGDEVTIWDGPDGPEFWCSDGEVPE